MADKIHVLQLFFNLLNEKNVNKFSLQAVRNFMSSFDEDSDFIDIKYLLLEDKGIKYYYKCLFEGFDNNKQHLNPSEVYNNIETTFCNYDLAHEKIKGVYCNRCGMVERHVLIYCYMCGGKFEKIINMSWTTFLKSFDTKCAVSSICNYFKKSDFYQGIQYYLSNYNDIIDDNSKSEFIKSFINEFIRKIIIEKYRIMRVS